MKMLKETDRLFRKGTNMKRIKFVERAGLSLQDMLVSGNPRKDIKCGRVKCFICRSEKGGMGQCMKENALYSIRCLECRTKERISEYWGETGRNCYVRGKEHLTGFKERREDNAMWKQDK